MYCKCTSIKVCGIIGPTEIRLLLTTNKSQTGSVDICLVLCHIQKGLSTAFYSSGHNTLQQYFKILQTVIGTENVHREFMSLSSFDGMQGKNVSVYTTVKRTDLATEL